MKIRAGTTVIIVGAGLTGIGAAFYLARHRIAYIVLEKTHRVGGVWSTQQWPGMRCDTDIIKYSYSFKPFISDHALVSGSAIATYLEDVCSEFGLVNNVVFNATVEKAVFSTKEACWYVHTSAGVFKARFLINGNGYFLEAPHIPEIPAADTFNGNLVHIFDLNDKVALDGKRIILVGSGASAVTAVPALAAKGRSVTVVQRSPSYIYEGTDEIGKFVRVAQKLFRAGFKYPVQIVRHGIQFKDDFIFLIFRMCPRMGRAFFRYHWKDTVDKETYAQDFSPPYNPWEQRICLSIGLKEAMRNGKVKIVTGKIARFRETGIVLEHGPAVDGDVCVLATGFDLCFFKFDVFIDETAIQTEGINFYKGMMMGGIPNYFQPFGPPHSSFTGRIEVIVKLIVKIIRRMERKKLRTVGIERRSVTRKPRITPGYVMRSLGKLPVIYGTTQVPTIDKVLFYRLRGRKIKFTKRGPD